MGIPGTPSYLLIVAALLAIDHAPIAAQRAPAFQYVVKTVCARSRAPAVAPGTQFTAINIHTPDSGAAVLRFKVASATNGEVPGPVSDFVGRKIGPVRALEIDCPSLLRLGRVKELLKGFAVIATLYLP